MDRARIASKPIPKEAIEIKIIKRDWGIERSYKTPNGTEVCTPAPFLFLSQVKLHKAN